MSGHRPTIRHTCLVGMLHPHNGTSSSHVGGAAVMAPRSRTARLDRWRKASIFPQIAPESAKTNLATFNAAPRCGEKRKRDGEPCQKPAMKNGRCAIHGGKTPRGRQYHVIQWPDCSSAA